MIKIISNKTIMSLGFCAFLFLTTSSCQRKSGCESAEKISQAHLDKKGNLSTKRGSSNLFSKKMRKKMR